MRRILWEVWDEAVKVRGDGRIQKQKKVIEQVEADMATCVARQSSLVVIDASSGDVPDLAETRAASTHRMACALHQIADSAVERDVVLVGHGNAVGEAVREGTGDHMVVYEIDYCGYALLRREVVQGDQEGFVRVGPWSVVYTSKLTMLPAEEEKRRAHADSMREVPGVWAHIPYGREENDSLSWRSVLESQRLRIQTLEKEKLEMFLLKGFWSPRPPSTAMGASSYSRPNTRKRGGAGGNSPVPNFSRSASDACPTPEHIIII